MSFTKLLLVVAVLLVGCTSRKTAPPPQAQTNVLGVVKTRPGSYAKLSPTSINVHTDELGVVDEYTGNNTSLFWGVVTVADY